MILNGSSGVVFKLTHRVHFHETDMAGVVHFSNFFRWMEEVEHAFFRSLGLSVAMQHDGAEVGWPRVSASCDYLAPARFEEEIQLHLKITKVGRKSLNFEVEFQREGTPIARGRIASVCCTMTDQGMAAMAVPPEIRAKLVSAAASHAGA